jgi:hypothetical protein
MTVVALDQPFEYTVPKRHIELTLLRQMTRKTQLGLGLREKKFFCSRVMSRMAVCATHAVLGVDRIDGVHVLRTSGMAAHAASIDLFRGMVFENEKLGFVAGILYVCCCRPVAALAARFGGVTRFVQGGLPMLRLLPSNVQFLVAGLACVCGCILVGAF